MPMSWVVARTIAGCQASASRLTSLQAPRRQASLQDLRRLTGLSEQANKPAGPLQADKSPAPPQANTPQASRLTRLHGPAERSWLLMRNTFKISQKLHGYRANHDALSRLTPMRERTHQGVSNRRHMHMVAYVPVSEALPQPPRQTGLCFSCMCLSHPGARVSNPSPLGMSTQAPPGPRK